MNSEYNKLPNRNLNDSYSDHDKNEYVEINGDVSSKDEGLSTFCFCANIEQGVKIIGVLEVIYAILQLFNIQYAPRLSITLFLLINLPLNAYWLMGQKSKSEGRADMAYRYNTLFKSWYLLRMLAFTIGGLVFLVIATRNDEPVDYFCTRYYEVTDADLHSAELGNQISQ